MITVELEHFSLDKICDSGQCFRMRKLGDGHFSMVAGDQYLEMYQKDGVVDFCCSQEEFICYWVLYFDLDTDYEAYMNAANPRDKYLGAAIKAGDGIRILRQDLWEMIVTFLISQQNNIKRIRKCIETICRKYGERKKFICRCGVLRFSDCRGAESGNGRGVKRMRLGIPGKIYRSNGQDHCIRPDLSGKNL